MNLCTYQELKVIKEALKKDLIFISDPFSFVTWNTCLHGLGIPSLTFIEGAEKLKEEYRFIVLYASGHGKMDSLDLTEEYEMPNIIDWLHEIVDILEIDQFYSLSHSWGSFVYLFYINKDPQRVKGTMLIDGGYQTKRLKVQTLEEVVAHYEKDFDEYIFDGWDDFFKIEKAAYTRWSPMIEVAVKDLAVEKEGKVHWHASGTTAVNIIKAMHKHETIDIYENYHLLLFY